MTPARLGHGLRGELGRRLLLAYLGAGVALAGIQAVLPALPVMQRALGLSEAQISLVVSVYLLPSVLLAMPIGLLTDRVGRREVYVGALAVFGLAGVALLFVHSFAFLLGMRILQGTAFAAMLPLSITMIADVTRGRAGVKAQGQRAIVMRVFDGVLPAVGGGFATLAWYGPFGLQLLALPLALIGWWWLPPREVHRTRGGDYVRDFRQVLRMRGVWPLQFVGFGRLFLKFVVLTYFPILAVSERGIPPVAVGLALGAMAMSGAISAALAWQLVSRVHAGTVLMASMAASGAALLATGAVRLTVVAVAALVVIGFADGLLGVIQNFLAGSVVPHHVRSGFVAMTATTRNLGKFLAPLAFGLLVVFISVEQVFLIAGVLAVLAVAPLRAVRPLVRTAGADIKLPDTTRQERTS